MKRRTCNGDVVLRVIAGLDVSIAGFGACRLNSQHHHVVADRGHGDALLQGFEEPRLIGDDMIGREDSQHGIRILPFDQECGQAACRRRVAGDRFLNDLPGRQSGQLIGDFVSQEFIGDNPGFSSPARGFRRSTVCWIMERSPSSASTCLARARRERGQNRVPLPPARITGRKSIDFDIEDTSYWTSGTFAQVHLPLFEMDAVTEVFTATLGDLQTNRKLSKRPLRAVKTQPGPVHLVGWCRNFRFGATLPFSHFKIWVSTVWSEEHRLRKLSKELRHAANAFVDVLPGDRVGHADVVGGAESFAGHGNDMGLVEKARRQRGRGADASAASGLSRNAEMFG